MKKIVFYFLLLVFCLSCEKLIAYKDFILKKTLYTGNELRMDGYYYRYLDCEGNNCIFAYCFYRNGIVLHMGGGALSLEEADEEIKQFIKRDINSNYERLNWGLFVIDNQTIKFELYYPQEYFTKWTGIMEGVILNDTTFRITSFYDLSNDERYTVNDTFYFRQFSPKPDSTVANKWIK
ncbi:MAG TPA: hypothetical protein PLW70_09135 [Bacteroidales bacterium]|nr:hypothetical protein [Bacteroidales bacterium]